MRRTQSCRIYFIVGVGTRNGIIRYGIDIDIDQWDVNVVEHVMMYICGLAELKFGKIIP